MKDELLGRMFGTWTVLGVRSDNPSRVNPFYNCKCNTCGITHIVSKANVLAKIACPTCPEAAKSSVDDIIGIFGSVLGIDDNKRKDINVAFEKLNQPEFKEIYSSLERASISIKNVMGGQSGAPDVARKILEAESANLKNAFNGLIEDGKISEEEARILKTEINSSANMQKLKSMLEIMKQQTRETKKV